MSNLSEQSRAGAARGALAEAADRFDRLARVVKDQQLSETRSGPRIALNESYGASPEEAWAKNFMTQAIGPAMTTFSVPTVPAFVPIGQAPLPSHGFETSIPRTAGAPRKESASFRPGGDLRVGNALREQPTARRRRSWVGWLLLGR
jgi:hypothetical protein